MVKTTELTQQVTSRTPKEVHFLNPEQQIVGRVVELGKGKWRWDVVDDGEHKLFGEVDGREDAAVTRAKDEIVKYHGASK